MVVGEPEAGKSAIIKAFMDYEDPDMRDNQIGSRPTPSMSQSKISDFSLKIIKLDGEKVRIQLWDQGLAKDPQSTFQPLFTRHAAGCIVVGNTLNLQTLKK